MANPDPNPHLRFKPGQIANPSGKRGLRFAERLNRECSKLLSEYDGDKRRVADEIAAVVVNMARKGNLDAIKWLVERTDGKVPDKLYSESSIIEVRHVRRVASNRDTGPAPGSNGTAPEA